jgi:hypothetical protein
MVGYEGEGFLDVSKSLSSRPQCLLGYQPFDLLSKMEIIPQVIKPEGSENMKNWQFPTWDT